jgi:transcriptional regulator with GAF, ATPase, and Fis domain
MDRSSREATAVRCRGDSRGEEPAERGLFFLYPALRGAAFPGYVRIGAMASSPKKPKPARPVRDPLADIREMENTRRAARRPADPVPAPAPAGGAEPRRSYDDLLDVAVLLASTLDLKDILDHIVDGIIRVTRCERGFVMLRESDGSFSTFTGRRRDNQGWDEESARATSRSIRDAVVNTREPYIETDLEHVTTGSIHEHRILAAVCLPLIYKNDLIGVIYADSGRIVPKFVKEDRRMLLAFGAQASQAVENARHHGEIKSERDRLEGQNLMLREQLSRQFAMSGMISKNKRMLEVFETVAKIAPRDSTVLIEGETGTGKDLLARAIHEKSARSGGPFEAQNCANIPPTLVESILFGHRKGAFTGADYDKPGVFEIANDGTLFLDEIGDMPLALQANLLRVLENGEVTRLGEEGRVRKVNVRIVAATNQGLQGAVEKGRFREDLYHRLNVVRVMLPPLRERREDIIPLAEYFLGRLAEAEGQPHPRLSRAAASLIRDLQWPGNVRQLKNAMESAYALRGDDHVIHSRDLERFFGEGQREPQPDDASVGALNTQVDRFEERVIRRVLEENQNNVTATARALDISRQQLHKKILKYGISTRPE